MAARKVRRTVVVTGGTRGIGAAIAEAFQRDGCRLVIGARTDNGAARRLGRGSRFQKTDVRRKADLERLVQFAVETTGRLDVFVNCAGVSAWRPIDEVDEPFWRDMIDVNLSGAFWGMQAAAARLGRGGVIINVSSLAGKRGSANNAVYCAAKFGLNGMTQALAKELGPRGVRVNAVCPVYVETPGLTPALTDPRSPAGGRRVKSYLKDFAVSNAALRRLPRASEVADVCVYLASDRAGAITGQCLNVDCGVLPQ